MNQKDIRISARLQTIMRKVVALVDKECGETMAVALFIHPFAETEKEAGKEREFQYVSNMQRSHMHGMLKATVAKWDANQPDVPPHLRQ